jgi:hypothetical protein
MSFKNLKIQIRKTKSKKIQKNQVPEAQDEKVKPNVQLIQ